MTEKHISYDAVLRRAQEKGYAEANPSADVDGLDAARKAAILASLALVPSSSSRMSLLRGSHILRKTILSMV